MKISNFNHSRLSQSLKKRCLNFAIGGFFSENSGCISIEDCLADELSSSPLMTKLVDNKN